MMPKVFYEANEPVAVEVRSNQVTFKNLFAHPQGYDVIVDRSGNRHRYR
jgi:hypothetical protein